MQAILINRVYYAHTLLLIASPTQLMITTYTSKAKEMCSAQSMLGADLALMDQTKRLQDANWQLIKARHWGFVSYSSILITIVVMMPIAYPKN